MKAAEKALKEEYINIVIDEVWKDDRKPESWRKYYNGHIARVVQFSNGDLYAIEKPHINKDFCFGYSCSAYDTESYDNATSAADYARNSKDYFKSENLKQIDPYIELLSGDSRYTPYIVPAYYSCPKSTRLKNINSYSLWDIDNNRVPADAVKLSPEDASIVLAAYQEERKAFEKRIDTYLKRYGTSKVRSWTYWQDE